MSFWGPHDPCSHQPHLQLSHRWLNLKDLATRSPEMKLRKAKKDPVNTLFSQLRQRHFTTSAITGSPCGANGSPSVWPTWCCFVLGRFCQICQALVGFQTIPLEGLWQLGLCSLFWIVHSGFAPGFFDHFMSILTHAISFSAHF